MNLTYFNLKNLALLIGTAVMLVFFLGGCSKGGSNPTPKNTTPKLAITALSVNSGPYMTLVSLTGTGFSTTLANNQVFFNGVAATPINVTLDGTGLSVTVPLGAGTGPVTATVNGVTATGPVFTYQPEEIVSTLPGNFTAITGIAIDGSGNIYVADVVTNTIQKITPTGVQSVLAGGTEGFADGTGAAASFTGIEGMTIDANGNLYVVDAGNSLIRKVTPLGVVTTLAGNRYSSSTDGVGTSASFSMPWGIVIDASGNLYVTDVGTSRIRKITPAGVVSTLTTTGLSFGVKGITIDKTGNLYVSDQTSNQIIKITTAGIASAFAQNTSSPTVTFDSPTGLAIDANGNIFAANQFNGTISKITPAGVASVFAGLSATLGFTDGPVAVATFGAPLYIAFDASGNMYISDNARVRKISFQ